MDSQTFLYNRTQIVAVDGETSDKVHVESRVPQGNLSLLESLQTT
jgi:hypothetical protein